MTHETPVPVPVALPAFDIADWLKQEAERTALAAQILPANKAAVFDALVRHGIASVTVTFDGCGDSGQIEEIIARSADDCEISLPDEEIEIALVDWHAEEARLVRTGLADAIEQLCYGLLGQEHGGWENNDGAFGEFAFDAADRTIALEHNTRFSSSELSTHQW